MRKIRQCLRITILLAACLLLATAATAQPPHPRDVFGFTPGDDYKLANYAQMLDYYRQLDAASPRVHLQEIGTSVLGRPLLLLAISSEANLRELDKWRDTSTRLARARLDDDEARRLARDGRAVVWIDGGLHATERAGAQMTTLLAHRVATEETAEMEKIRDHTILLLMPVMNPDGLDIVVDWYQKQLGTPYETTSPPWLYHFYVGHDNNRDWFMNNMPESRAVTRTLYNEWYPQIVYNHHQTSPAWARIFVPPFADPVNPHIHPGVTTGVNLVGSAMANRLAMRELPGVVSGVIFSMWWNGGMRTVPYFHNMIGILTETAHATPTPRFYDPDSLPKFIAARRGSGMHTDGTEIFYPDPWRGGESRFGDAVNYMLEASMAVLNIAADLREQWLYNIYRMGRDAIGRGSRGDPFAYVIPPQQWHAGEEVELVNILQLGGVEIHRAERAFRAGERQYPAGSFIVFAAQPFRPYVLDLLEKQQYPDRRQSPDGPPDPPYDLAGWTLPLQMGVDVDRIDVPFEAATTAIAGPVEVAAGSLKSNGSYGYLLSSRPNRTVLTVNHLLAAGEQVSMTGRAITVDGVRFDAGSYVVRRGDSTRARLQRLAQRHGVSAQGLAKAPDAPLHAMQLPKIGLYKSWVANMDEGWTRWLLTQYAFAHDTLHDADIRAGNLSRYDAIVLPDQSPSSILNGHLPGTMPEPYTGGLGLDGALALQRYVENGGMLVAFDEAGDFAIEQFGLPVRNVVAGTSSRQFFIPGSLVRLELAQSHPLAYGMPAEAAASFVRSRAFAIRETSRTGEGGREPIAEAPAPAVEVIARYARNDILLSGWAMGEQRHIGGRAALVEAKLGQGSVVLFGFRPQFRGQPRGTYKLFFNALQLAAMADRPPAPRSAPAEADTDSRR